jgi:aspartyl-tRNA(Asn)/glutamyl-tRNA(Gln) amidotransferase subunit A
LGVPLAVKDLLNVAGQPCRCASRILEGYTAPYDATAVARLRAEGAVFVGRTNMDEFGMGSSSENSAFGPVRNPWDSGRVAGGSSGGSAAAVAADLAVAALGTDTGGSVRQPASFCGCVGIKPSYGRVSRYGLTAYASSLDQVGPLAKDVRDAALLLGVMAGRDERDATSLDVPVPDYAAALAPDGLAGLRLGMPREYLAPGMDPGVAARVREAARLCESLGATVAEVDLAMTRHAVAAYYVLACAEASSNLARFDGIRYGFRAAGAADPIALYGATRAQGFGAEVKRRILLGTYVLSSGYYEAYYVRAQKVRTLIRRDFDRAFAACDLLLAPVAPTPAFRLGERLADPLQMYLGDVLTVPANLAGLCALSVPCGFTDAGLPVGLQLIGPALAEERLLRAAFAYESAAGWRGRRPPARQEGP